MLTSAGKSLQQIAVGHTIIAAMELKPCCKIDGGIFTAIF